MSEVKHVISEIELVACIERGLSRLEIAEHFGCSEPTIKRALKKYSIKMPKKEFIKKVPTKDILESMHIKQGMSMAKMAEFFDVRYETLKKWFNHYDIKPFQFKSERFESTLTPPHIKDDELHVFIGALLGDSWMTIRESTTIDLARFHFCHTAAQKDYLNFKLDKIDRFFSTKNLIVSDGYIADETSFFKKGYNIKTSYSIASKSLTILHPLWYIFYGQFGGEKHVPQAIETLFSWDTFAYWYGDDGSYSYHDNLQLWLGHPSGHTGTPQDSKDVAARLFKKLNLSFDYIRTKQGVDGVSFDRESSTKIMEECLPRLPECMHYKFRILKGYLDRSRVFLSSKIWDTFSQEENNLYKEDIFKLYRHYGFPYVDHAKTRTRDYFSNMVGYDYLSLVEDKDIGYITRSANITDGYFPHRWEVRSGGSLTPVEAFNDDFIFRDAIDWMLRNTDKVDNRNMLRALKYNKNVRYVNSFNPSTAAAIYDKFCPENGVVWDMCAGWGGRLIGALVSKKVKKYIGTDPSEKTYLGLLSLCEDISDLHNKEVEILKQGSEDTILSENSIDFCFTSPPYFNHERYAEESTQSFIKFPTKDLWSSEFLKRTFSNVFLCLKPGCFLAINIKGVPAFTELEEFSIEIAKECGFSYVDKYDIIFKSRFNWDREKESTPLYIFQKPII